MGGNLTAGPPLDIHLEIATGSDGPVLSTTAFDLVTGEYYRLNVTSDGVEPWRLEVDELLRNSHLRLVTINGIEVHLQALPFRAIEFDVAGTAQFSFTPIRTGERSTALSVGCCRIRRAREASRTGRTAGAGGYQETDATRAHGQARWLRGLRNSPPCSPDCQRPPRRYAAVQSDQLPSICSGLESQGSSSNGRDAVGDKRLPLAGQPKERVRAWY